MELEGVGASDLAMEWRDYVLVSLLSRFPLRRKHFASMTYKEDDKAEYIPNGSNLRKLDDGGWLLYLPAKEFKNGNRNKQIFGPNGDQDVTLKLDDHKVFQSFIPIIEEYMNKHRPVLLNGETDGPVFPFSVDAKKDNTADQVSRAVERWTQNYLAENSTHRNGLRIKGVQKFNPHAFRHLVATHVIIQTGSFEPAAFLLLDSIETIQMHYGRFLPGHRMAIGLRALESVYAPATSLSDGKP